MQHYRSLQTYVPPQIVDWIRDRAQERSTSVSVVIRDLLIVGWTRDSELTLRPPETDPARQLVFITVALDAILTHHDNPTLRERVLAAYHRRLAKLDLVSGPNVFHGDS